MVDDGSEGETVGETGGEIGDANGGVTGGDVLGPVEDDLLGHFVCLLGWMVALFCLCDAK